MLNVPHFYIVLVTVALVAVLVSAIVIVSLLNVALF